MSSNKRVVVFAPLFKRLPTHGYGAIEKLTLERVTSLKRAGYKVQFVGPIDDLNFADEVINVEKTYKFPSNTLSRSLSLLNLSWTKYMKEFINLRRNVWDAPILSDAAAMDPFNNFFLAKNYGINRIIFFLHGNFYTSNGIGRYLFAPMDLFTNVSKKINFAPLNYALFNYMKSNGYKVKYMPSGAEFPSSDKIITTPRDYAMFIGVINQYKAPHLAIKLAKKIGIRLLLIGPSYDKVYFEKFILPNLDERIRYLGEVDRSCLDELLRNSKCLFFTSTWNEPQGLVILEALSWGVPVLSLKPGPFSGSFDMISQGETGYIGDFDDLVANSEQIFSLKRSEIQAKASSKWSWNNIIKNYYDNAITEMQSEISGMKKNA